MSRLTERDEDGAVYYLPCMNCEDQDCVSCEFDEEIAQKLAHYEDLEEQGILIELPCKPDEPVWEAHKYYPPRQTMYCNHAHILESMNAGYCIGYTKAEAERKLEEMEGK